jgi:hypothetical protein
MKLGSKDVAQLEAGISYLMRMQQDDGDWVQERIKGYLCGLFVGGGTSVF